MYRYQILCIHFPCLISIFDNYQKLHLTVQIKMYDKIIQNMRIQLLRVIILFLSFA